MNASSHSGYDASANSAKGIVFPRVNLSAFTSFYGNVNSMITGVNSYDNNSKVLIFGGSCLSALAAGTYDYVIEYFK